MHKPRLEMILNCYSMVLSLPLTIRQCVTTRLAWFSISSICVVCRSLACRMAPMLFMAWWRSSWNSHDACQCRRSEIWWLQFTNEFPPCFLSNLFAIDLVRLRGSGLVHMIYPTKAFVPRFGRVHQWFKQCSKKFPVLASATEMDGLPSSSGDDAQLHGIRNTLQHVSCIGLCMPTEDRNQSGLSVCNFCPPH